MKLWIIISALTLLLAANTAMMWFKRNGHFAKNDSQESEVSHECQKSQTTIHSRIQR